MNRLISSCAALLLVVACGDNHHPDAPADANPPADANLCAAVTCTASDACHEAGTCDAATGRCSNPAKADGVTCNDSNACTQSDVCHAGVCGGTAYTCNPNNCVDGAACNGDGTCSFPAPPARAPRNLALSFAAPSFAASGTAPQYAVIGDLNRDCKADIAVTNLNSNNLSVFLGDGSGTFGTPTAVATGANPVGLVASDFNRDGILDLAVANNADNTLLILLGNGAGGFTVHVTLPVPTGSRPSPLVVADFNGDGFADLAAGNGSTASISVLLGDGTGGFAAATSVAVGTLPLAMAVGDFNGDHYPDLAVANLINNNVSVLLGNGTGGFGAATNFAVGGSPEGVLVTDLNEDGKLDLVLADNGSNNLSVLIGDGAGNFAGTSLAEGNTAASGPSFVVGGDLDLDGHVDLFVVNNREGTVGVLPGSGAGTFPGPFSYTDVGRIPGRAVVGDLNGDGLPDAVFTSGNSNGIGVMLNTSH